MISFNRQDIDVFTIETSIPWPDHLENLILSAKKYNWDLTITGSDSVWAGWRTKLDLTRKYLESSDKTHFVYLDSRDSLFNKKYKTFVSDWKKNYSEFDVIFSGETNCYPITKLSPYFGNSKYRYLNAGVFCGKSKSMISIIDFVQKNFDLDDKEFVDQGGYTHAYLSRMFNIKIDDECKLFQTLWEHDGGRSANFDMVYTKDLIYNETYGTIPSILHAPGPTCVMDQSVKILKGKYVT